MTSPTPKAGAMDEAIEAIVAAMKPDRIQGFTYGDQHVIRDVWLPYAEQVIWRGPNTDREAFDRQIEIERMRAALRSAGFRVARPVADAELQTQIEDIITRHRGDFGHGTAAWSTVEVANDILSLLAARDAARDAQLATLRADYEEVLADHRRLVREMDVKLNGEAGAAKQASLCDLVGQVEDLAPLRAEVSRLGETLLWSAKLQASLAEAEARCATMRAEAFEEAAEISRVHQHHALYLQELGYGLSPDARGAVEGMARLITNAIRARAVIDLEERDGS